MRSFIWLIFLIPLLSFGQEPEIWGQTYTGGKVFGTIFKTDENGEKFEVVHLFGKNPGRNPMDRLFKASNGKMYGVTANGGEFQAGNLFEYDLVANETRKIIDFGGITGHQSTELVESNGKLYGANYHGGIADDGVLYEYDPVLDSFRVVFGFDRNTTGGNVHGEFCVDSNGLIYGTANGGPGGLGVIFSFDPGNYTYNRLYDLSDTLKGWGPQSVTLSKNGNIYGTTFLGGTSKVGVIFEYDVINQVYTKLWDFDPINARSPLESLLEVYNGRFMGVTAAGGTFNKGVLYQFDINDSTFAKLHDFNSGSSSAAPKDLVLAPNGKIYGTTWSGGNNNDGMIYEFDTATANLSVIHHFSYGITGYNPQGMIIGDNGNLYGICFWGGKYNGGNIYEFNIDSASYHIKLDFDDYSEGAYPTSNLMQASNGKVYGLMHYGGKNDSRGMVFEIDPSNNDYQVKYSLGKNASDGLGIKNNGLVEFNNELYGMTAYGGLNKNGTIFKYDFINDTGITLFRFIDSTGTKPYGTLIVGPDSLLYGTALVGGLDNGGTIFSFNPITNECKKLYTFDRQSDNGANPSCDLTYVGNNKVYGLAGQSNDAGVIFEFDVVTKTYIVKYRFDDSYSGKVGEGSLTKARNGALYGTTINGPSGSNVFFKYDIKSESFTKILEFDNSSQCCNTTNRLIHASNNKIYGSAPGHNFADGVIFEYDTERDEYKIKHQFKKVSEGLYPRGGLLELNAKYTGVPSFHENQQFKIYPNPNNGSFTLMLDNQSNGELFVYNTFGSLIYRKTISNKSPIEIYLPISISDGVYFLQYIGKDGISTEKFIVNRDMR